MYAKKLLPLDVAVEKNKENRLFCVPKKGGVLGYKGPMGEFPSERTLSCKSDSHNHPRLAVRSDMP